MDIDADADGDAEADLDDAEAEVEGDLAALVDQAASSPPHSGARHRAEEDMDIAALAGVDDDPDDYDSPATTNALKRQLTVRDGPATKTAGETACGPSPASADADAELDILEAVDAAEANSAASSSGLKAEDSS